MKLLTIGQAVIYAGSGGSVGRIDSQNHYGGFYVRWNYGRDIAEKPMTGISSVESKYLWPIDEELYKQYETCAYKDQTQLRVLYQQLRDSADKS